MSLFVGQSIRVQEETFCLQRPLLGQSHRQSWQALRESSGHSVFVKTVPRNDAQGQAQLENEAEALTRLKHPSLPELLRFGPSDSNLLVLVSEWIEGVPLSRLVSSDGLACEQIYQVGRSLWCILDHLHASGVIHGDLKPDHLILSGDGVRLCDFGLSLRRQRQSHPGTTVDYAAPEQLGLLRHPVSEESDLYSAGVLLTECITGKLPWENPHDLSHRLAPLQSITNRTSLPRSMESLLEHLLRPDPRGRYSSARAVSEDWDKVWHNPDTLIPLGTTDRRRYLTAPSLVGRQEELERIDNYLKRKSPRPLWISARSGRGKSALLTALSKRARRLGFVVTSSGSSPQMKSPPFVWSQILHSLFSQVGSQVRDRLISRIRDGELVETFSRFVQESSKPDPAENSHLENTATRILELLESVPLPLLLCLDDVQWADPLTLALLRRELPSNLKIVASYRSEEFPFQDYADETIELEPLCQADAEQLLFSMAGPLPKQAVEPIVERAQGEPFLLSAILLGAQEMGILTHCDQEWTWNSSGALQTGLKAGVVLSQRLSLCKSVELDFLRVGAIWDREFSVSETLAILGLDLSLAESILDSTTKRQLLWRLSPDRVQFSHDKIRENLLETLDAQQLSDLHSRTAQWLESLELAAPERLAYHWFAANQPDRAFPYAWTSGEQALANLNPSGAIELLEIAKKSLPQPPDSKIHFRILHNLALAYRRMNQYDLAIENFERAVEMAGDEEGPLILGELCHTYVHAMKQSDKAAEVISDTLSRLGNPIPPSNVEKIAQILICLMKLGRRMQQGTLAQPGSQDPWFRARLLTHHALLEKASYDNDALTILWSVALGCDQLSAKSGPSEGGITWAMAGTLCCVLRLPKLADRFFELATATAGSDLRHQGRIIAQSACLAVTRGRLSEAKELSQAGASLSRSQNDWWNIDTAESFAALFSYHRGEFPRATKLAREIWERQSFKETNYYSTILIMARCGAADTFETELKQAYPDLAYRRLRFLVKNSLAMICLKDKRWVEAIQHLEETVKFATQETFLWGTCALPWLATGWRKLAEELPPEASALRNKLLRQAARAAERALKGVDPWVLSEPHALRECALSSVHFGRFNLARVQFEKSLKLSEKIGMALESAWTLYERGRVARVAGWSDWESDFAKGAAQARRLGCWFPGLEPCHLAPEHHLAKLERFDHVLESGRRLVVIEREAEVYEALKQEAHSLLRSDQIQLIPPGELPSELSQTLYDRCLAEKRAVTETRVDNSYRDLPHHEAGSTIVAPVMVENSLTRVLVCRQKSIGDFFGEEETRLADYLCTLAGAAIENARTLAQRKKTFEALKTSEQRFRGFFEYAGVGTALLDEDGVILQENRYLRTLLGGPVREKSLWQLTHATDRDSLRAGFVFLKNDSSQRYDSELRLHRAGGEVVWTQSCLVAIPAQEGDRSRYLLTVSDITHRRIAEMMEFLENERRGLAAEIHDELAQSISALAMMLAALKTEDPMILQPASLARRLVDDTSTLMASLRNPLSEGVDLIAALKSLVTNFSIECEAEIVVDWPINSLPLSDLAGLVLYRAIQEGLSNVRKHAQASKVELRFHASSTHVEALLTDNGKGFDASKWLSRQRPRRHFGLLSMRDRLEMVRGRVSLVSEPSHGTTLAFRVPISFHIEKDGER